MNLLESVKDEGRTSQKPSAFAATMFETTSMLNVVDRDERQLQYSLETTAKAACFRLAAIAHLIGFHHFATQHLERPRRNRTPRIPSRLITKILAKSSLIRELHYYHHHDRGNSRVQTHVAWRWSCWEKRVHGTVLLVCVPNTTAIHTWP